MSPQSTTTRVIRSGTQPQPIQYFSAQATPDGALLQALRESGVVTVLAADDLPAADRQGCYATSGMGLVWLDAEAIRACLIPQSLFEIVSVGAVAICPDMPWIRTWFGDSVRYFDPARPLPEIAAAIAAHRADCTAHPDRADAQGDAARQVFEAHFSAERMLSNLVEFHARAQAHQARRLATLPPAPAISVIMRCGGRDIAFVERAVTALRRQTYGAITLILAKYRPIDTSTIAADRSGAIVGVDEFLIEGGGRAEMLWAGLNRVTTPYFAVLDDDDYLLSDHFESLFRAGLRVDPAFDVAFSGQVDFEDAAPAAVGPTAQGFRIARFGFQTRIPHAWAVASVMGTNGFVARRDLLSEEMLQAPPMRTAEDSLLIMLISRRSKPVFSWRPTAFYRENAPDGSNWRNDEQRSNDEISFALRAGLMWSPRWLQDGAFDLPQLIWSYGKQREDLAANEEKTGAAQIAMLQTEIAAMRRSTSWRLTAPMRRVMSLTRRRGQASGAESLPSGTPDAAALRVELDAIRNSTSWRLTAPLRGLIRMLRDE